ncbi:MAG: hypothetical protein ACXWDO_12310 [Bacteroidia bacterium]
MEITQNYDILLTNINFSKESEKIPDLEKEETKYTLKKENSYTLPQMFFLKSGKNAKYADSPAWFYANKSPEIVSPTSDFLPQKNQNLTRKKNIYLYAIIIAALLGIALLLIGSFTAIRLLYLAGLLLFFSVVFVVSNIWGHRKGDRKLLYNNFRETTIGAFLGSILFLGIILLINYFATVTLLSLVIVYVLSLLLLVTAALFLGSALAWLIMYLTEFKKPAQYKTERVFHICF